jgi:hypothetical protein
LPRRSVQNVANAIGAVQRNNYVTFVGVLVKGARGQEPQRRAVNAPKLFNCFQVRRLIVDRLNGNHALNVSKGKVSDLTEQLLS